MAGPQDAVLLSLHLVMQPELTLDFSTCISPEELQSGLTLHIEHLFLTCMVMGATAPLSFSVSPYTWLHNHLLRILGS